MFCTQKYNKVKTKEQRESIFSIEDFKENLKDKSLGFKNVFKENFNLSNKKRIRKVYSKKIKEYKHKGIIVEKYFTPLEISNNVKTNMDNDIKEATEIYEKARYSQEECSKEDVERIKSLF